MKPDFDDVMNVAGLDDEQLLQDLKDLIRQADALKPRSLQKALGPSEVGHPCLRRLAFGTVNARKHARAAENGAFARPAPIEGGLNRFNDPLAAIIGTAMHAWLEDAVRTANQALGRVRWIPEQPVSPWDGLRGTCDLYDADTRTVLDWKVPGQTRHAHYKKHGPSPVYKTQAHLYGAGYRNEFGLPVEKVGIVFLSRTGGLRDTFLWREDYNQTLVDETQDKLADLDRRIAELDLIDNPGNFAQIPITPTADCHFCNWYSPNPMSPFQCNAGRD